MKHKLIFRANDQTFTVFKTQDEIIRLLSLEGVELISVNDSGVDVVSTLKKNHDEGLTEQRKLVREKGIETKALADIAGVDKTTMNRWLNKDSSKYYQKVVDLVRKYEERR
ncbi:MAG: hypothetical protein IKS90_03480 [Clostridia bacterium]|nr:hypothetical protein [Clostridia bacterium]